MPPCRGLNWQRNYETDIFEMREDFNIHSFGVRSRLLRITMISKQKMKTFQEELPSKHAIPLHLRFILVHDNNLRTQRGVHVLISTLLVLYLDFTI